MKPSLQLKLSQHLTLTPQLQQSIKLLQLSTIELNQEIERVLLENPGKPLSRARLEESLYGWGEEIESNAVEVHLSGLRRKLPEGLIRNVRGLGWMIAAKREVA